ncbi:hypothetical protein M569_15859 [Genlisea aurea]|uniref:Uncharacterized protein n=1 Tax=Genlisea aurea TaxID=192259 RepID=S8D8E5_9LAMI|nr:hypothetical protein M569_15859 [Genlisea aurea]
MNKCISRFCAMMMKVSGSSGGGGNGSGFGKRRIARGFGGVLREQRARLYIIRRCVVMLLCYHD